MLIEMILNPIFEFFLGIMDYLPEVPAMEFSLGSVMIDVIRSAGYFIPIDVLFVLIVLEVAIWVLELAWKLILRAKSFIPTMGV